MIPTDDKYCLDYECFCSRGTSFLCCGGKADGVSIAGLHLKTRRYGGGARASGTATIGTHIGSTYGTCYGHSGCHARVSYALEELCTEPRHVGL